MKFLFGGLIAVVLLGLYVYAVIYAILIVNCLGTSGCSQYTVENFTSGFATVMTTVGGLVSALVIAELAITKPGEAPVARALGATPTAKSVKALKVVTGAYLLIWVAAGLGAFVFGAMLYPGKLQPLTDQGQAWLGLAVAAAYTYFNIKPGGVE